MKKRLLTALALALFALAVAPAITGPVQADPPGGQKSTCPPC